ncbi:MAG: glycosyltransferase family 4 protein [Bryobacteraceae bacterium]|jgi:glycosyltransferase involved in cell wall biosynthesis
MRILHLDAGKEMRGGQWQALRLLEGLAAAGVESTLLARRGGPLFEAARERGWRVEPLGLGRAMLLARRHDLVHAHDARGHTFGAIARSGRLVVSRRVAFPVGSPWKYRRARRYLAVSEFVKSVLMAGGVPEEKIAVVYDGVPLLEPARGSSVLAPANADDPRKGAPLAVAAASLAGVELKLSTDLERDLRDAAVFVYITHSEGLGSGALLAMAAGVPVVASNVGGLPEIIRHGDNGLLVDNTPQAIAAAIGKLLGDAAFARRMGDAARRTVMERFTVDHMVRRTMEVYRQVLS